MAIGFWAGYSLSDNRHERQALRLAQAQVKGSEVASTILVSGVKRRYERAREIDALTQQTLDNIGTTSYSCIPEQEQVALARSKALLESEMRYYCIGRSDELCRPFQ